MATMDEYFKKGEVYKNQSGSTVKIDWYDKNGEVQYTHNKQSQSATEKGLKNMLERNGYKKVNDIAMEYDPIMCMMVPKKAEDAKTWVVEYEDALGDDHKKTFSDKTAVEKFIRRGTDVGKAYHLKVNGKAVNNTATWTADEMLANMVNDQRTVDFSSSDAKAVFKYLDGDVERTLVNYRKGLNNCKTTADCERLENDIRKAMDNIVNEYFQIWNEVGAYAQKRKNEVIKEFVSLSTEVFKKYNSLSDK